MGGIPKTSTAFPSTEIDASKASFGGKKSAKARRYTADDDDDFGSDKQEA